MADLFSMTAPLLVRRPGGIRHIVAERFPLGDGPGMVYFELYWHLQRPAALAIHRLPGEIRGDGPWKIGDTVISVLGCHGSDPELAATFAEWQDYLRQGAPGYPAPEAIRSLARAHGAQAD